MLIAAFKATSKVKDFLGLVVCFHYLEDTGARELKRRAELHLKR